MEATLYGVPGSHPSLAAELMLRYKGVDYRRLDLIPVAHRGIVRALGFGGTTVPAVRLDGTRVQGTGEIARALDARRPDPPLFPLDPGPRRRVEEAEAWGDEAYQPVARRLIWAALKRDRSTAATYLEGARTPIPTPIAVRTIAPVAFAAARANRASDENVRRDLEQLPTLLDRVDTLLAERTLGGAEPNAADFQIATTTALLATMEDLRPLLAGRPGLEHGRRIAPDYPGHMPPVLPAGWLAR